MQLLTVVGAIAVLSNVVSAVPQPNEKIEQIQEKRWSWPWNSGSGHGGHGHGHGGGWGWGGDDDDDDEGDDDPAAASHSALPFTHPHLRPEETRSSSLVAATLLSSSSIAVSTASYLLHSISISSSLSSSSTGVSTVTDPVLSPISITISTSSSSSLTSTPAPVPLSPPISSSVINAISASTPSSTPLQATLILNQSTSLTLCSANPTSIITITESCTSTQWITVVESGTWTTMPLPANWTTTPLSTTSLPSSISGPPSGAPSLGANSTGIWTATPMVSSVASTSVLFNSSLSSSVATGPATGMRTGLWSSGSSLSTFVFSSSSPLSSTSITSSSSSKSASTFTKESKSTTLIFSTTTLPHSSSSPSSSSTSPTLEPTPISTGTMDLHPSTTIAFTTTVTTTQISGTPNPAAVHCGLHGLPVGDFFLAEFVEDKAGVDVSLRGCWEFCRGVYGIDKGCVSYSFYPEPGTGAPRCDLFGGSVAQSLDSITPQVPNVWFDLECGDPTLV